MVALQALHGFGIVHHDIFSENLLIGDEGHIVIANFTQSSRSASAESSRRMSFTHLPMTREGEGALEKAVVTATRRGYFDYYMMALLYYEMITGGVRFLPFYN